MFVLAVGYSRVVGPFNSTEEAEAYREKHWPLQWRIDRNITVRICELDTPAFSDTREDIAEVNACLGHPCPKEKQA